MKAILIVAALVALLGGAVGAASTRGSATAVPAHPLHDELRWTEGSGAWTRPAAAPRR